MNRLYTVQFSPDFEREDAIDWADKSPLVLNWRHELPYSLYVVSGSEARELASDFYARLGERGRVLVAEVNDNFSGRMTPDFWRLLRDKPAYAPATAG